MKLIIAGIVLGLSLVSSPGQQSGTNMPAMSETDRAEKAAFDRVMTAAFYPAMEAQDNHQPVDFPALRVAMEKYWAEAPNTRRTTCLTYYMDMFAKAHPDRVLAEWESFTNCASAVSAELARNKVRFAELSRQPFQFSFTAVDGRKVDTGQWRGRVVILDFWATWCTPCLKQMPALKRLYARYHDQGLEIAGVSLDKPEDRQKLVDYLEREKIPWPQYFDGKMWRTGLASTYAVNSAPTTFLLDREGRLVKIITLENQELEPEIKRLLTQGK